MGTPTTLSLLRWTAVKSGHTAKTVVESCLGITDCCSTQGSMSYERTWLGVSIQGSCQLHLSPQNLHCNIALAQNTCTAPLSCLHESAHPLIQKQLQSRICSSQPLMFYYQLVPPGRHNRARGPSLPFSDQAQFHTLMPSATSSAGPLQHGQPLQLHAKAMRWGVTKNSSPTHAQRHLISWAPPARAATPASCPLAGLFPFNPACAPRNLAPRHQLDSSSTGSHCSSILARPSQMPHPISPASGRIKHATSSAGLLQHGQPLQLHVNTPLWAIPFPPVQLARLTPAHELGSSLRGHCLALLHQLDSSSTGSLWSSHPMQLSRVSLKQQFNPCPAPRHQLGSSSMGSHCSSILTRPSGIACNGPAPCHQLDSRMGSRCRSVSMRPSRMF